MRIPSPIPAAVVEGIPIDDVTMDEAVYVIAGFVDEARASGRTFQVATVNVDFVVKAADEPDVAAILRSTDLNVADGRPILWHAAVSGTPLRERVTGADLLPQLVERGCDAGWRIVLFGSASGVAERVAAALRERHPGVEVTGISGPMMSDVTAMEQRWIDEIARHRPDVVCVALGNPKQERWIAAHRDAIGSCVLIGVGGTLDFLDGGKRRAPVWMQRAGLEWVFRAIQEPGRLGKRYMLDAVVFGPMLARTVGERLVRRRGASATTRSAIGHARDVRRAASAQRPPLG